MTSSNGVTMAFNAFPTMANGQLSGATTQLWTVYGDTGADLGLGPNATISTFQAVPSPRVPEGVLFTTIHSAGSTPNTPWRIVAVDPATGDDYFLEAQIYGSNTTYVPPNAI